MLNHRSFTYFGARSSVKVSILALTLLLVAGCGTLLPSQSGSQSNQASKPQAAPLNAPPAERASPPLQRYNSDQQNQIATQGYNDGYEDGAGGFPSSPSVGIANLNLTDPTEQKIYTDAYNRGYADGRGQSPSPSPGQSPSPSPTPTSTVLPARRAELQRKGRQEGFKDAQSGFAANPDSGIEALGLRDPAEIEIYTNAYNAGYRQQPSPSPTPTLSPGALAQLRQQGSDDGYADAQANLPQDADRGINLRGLNTTAERQAYTSGYNEGYQRYLRDQNPVDGGMW
ncbi:MAG: hypothetical protein RBJ76_11330 [Stenomitos frigidus ULC029]